MAADEPQIGPFLIRLSEDARLLEDFLSNPDDVIDAADELTDPEKKEILRSGDPVLILEELRREYPGMDVEVEPWKPIRFPLPFGMTGPVHRTET
jgi:hypothetical protein